MTSTSPHASDQATAPTDAPAPVEITVRGTSRQFHPAERATVHAGVGLEGPEAGRVYDAVAEQFAVVQASIVSLHEPDRGPVTWWSSQDVRTWSNRPWNKDGVQLPLVHHARTDLQVKFSDFARMSAWLSDMAGITGFHVEYVEWSLTVHRRQELARAARTRAVRDAQAKAQAYAEALKLGPIVPVSLAEAGMLAEGLHPIGESSAPFTRAAKLAGGDAELQLVPQDIDVTASVDARFVAGMAAAHTAGVR
ncbi:SIMPL domain-containing protein [Nocardioides ferulae]|uniref:SIMPL domain-containing protein n=1 Tax=Nocardioides ferulae TaxID=2340821 RepID=UPI000EB1A79C|nr:SIMPL domain-containing protein [Nocardioides ferulae]